MLMVPVPSLMRFVASISEAMKIVHELMFSAASVVCSSTRMKASRSSLSETCQSLPRAWIGIVKKPSCMVCVPLLDGLRVDGRAGAAGDDEGGAAEEELVHLVAGAVLGQLLEVEHLAHVKAHGRDHHPVPGLVDVLGLVGAHLHPPGVGADPGHLVRVEPVAALELEARRVAAGIAAPVAAPVAGLHLAGADDDEVASADVDLLRRSAGIEIVVGDALPVGQGLDALPPGDVEKYAAADELVLGVLNAEL